MEPIAVKEVKYIGGYRLEIIFTDNKKQLVDFEQFLKTHSHPQYNKYKKTENLKRFKIENGNVIWGSGWNMIFPVYDLYQGNVN